MKKTSLLARSLLIVSLVGEFLSVTIVVSSAGYRGTAVPSGYRAGDLRAPSAQTDINQQITFTATITAKPISPYTGHGTGYVSTGSGRIWAAQFGFPTMGRKGDIAASPQKTLA